VMKKVSRRPLLYVITDCSHFLKPSPPELNIFVVFAPRNNPKKKSRSQRTWYIPATCNPGALLPPLPRGSPTPHGPNLAGFHEQHSCSCFEIDVNFLKKNILLYFWLKRTLTKYRTLANFLNFLVELWLLKNSKST
jgi:hypothetical protein